MESGRASFDDDIPQQILSEGTSETGTAAMLAVMSLDENGSSSMQECAQQFVMWPEEMQHKFLCALLSQMRHPQLAEISDFITPLLQRDFISRLPLCTARKILSYLDPKSLARCEGVAKKWQQIIAKERLWKKLIVRNAENDPIWQGFLKKNGCYEAICGRGNDAELALANNIHKIYPEHQHSDIMAAHLFFRALYPRIVTELGQLERNWCTGTQRHTLINCNSESSKGVYCLQYDETKIVSGLRDNTIKVWDRSNLASPAKILTGHTGSVLCLQYDDRIIVSGSSDSTIRVWDVQTGDCLNTLVHHSDAVLHLRFGGGRMVTCSKDRTVAVWDMASPQDICVRAVMNSHRAAVNVVDFDDVNIVSASGDRTIKVWSTADCTLKHTLTGHRRGIACLQYKDDIIVSGSSDNTIKIWHVPRASCIRTLEGHEELVRCLRFDSKRIVSGAYDGKIKIWDMQAALNPHSSANSLCLATLNRHTGRVFRLQFDDFQVISSSHDDTIIIWDFMGQPSFTTPSLTAGVPTATLTLDPVFVKM